MLYDLPEEEDSLTSLATWRDGDKELTTLDSTDLVDKLSYNLHEIKEDWYVVAQAIEVDGVVNSDEKAAVDGLNEVTTEKKGTATLLVNTLPEGSVKEALKELPKTGDSASNRYTVAEEIVLMNMLGLLGYKKERE